MLSFPSSFINTTTTRAAQLEAILTSADDAILQQFSHLDLRLMVKNLSSRSFRVFAKRVHNNPRLLYLMQDLFQELRSSGEKPYARILSIFPKAYLLPNFFSHDELTNLRSKVEENVRRYSLIRNNRKRYFLNYYNLFVNSFGQTKLARTSPRFTYQNEFDISEVIPKIFDKFTLLLKSFGEDVRNSRILFRAYIVRTSPDKVTESFDWHRDKMGKHGFAQHTLVVMLGDPTNPENGWTGGELLCQKNEVYHGNVPLLDRPIVNLYPKQNQGIFFKNYDAVHKVTEIVGTGTEKPKRDILIINAISFKKQVLQESSDLIRF